MGAAARQRWISAVLFGVCSVAAAQDRQAASDDLTGTLRRVGERVEHWYHRAQTVVLREAVTIQPLRADLSPANAPRRLVFDLRVAWNPDRVGPDGRPEAVVLREPVSVNGRAAADADPGCMDPKPISPEPLAVLLPEKHPESRFSLRGAGRIGGRSALLVDYEGLGTAGVDVRWTEDCVTVSLPGRSRGRIWVDAATYDVLRFDDRLVGPFRLDVPREQIRRGAAASMVIEHAESSIRYTPVRFEDPVETLMLPSSIDTVTVIRGRGVQRVRISQRFSDHRRFLTEGRIVD